MDYYYLLNASLGALYGYLILNMMPTSVHLTFANEFKATIKLKQVTRWRSWLRHCAASRKVAGSIISCRTMALGLTQQLTEMNKGKAIPLQAWTGPEVSRSLRLPDNRHMMVVRSSALGNGRL